MKFDPPAWLCCLLIAAGYAAVLAACGAAGCWLFTRT